MERIVWFILIPSACDHAREKSGKYNKFARHQSGTGASRISGDMTLEPGNVIACGTSVGVCPMQDGDVVEVSIPGIGVLTNHFG